MKAEVPQDLGERTTEFAVRIVKMFSAWPKSDEARTLSRRVLHSGTTIGANYREARRARNTAEFIAKIGDCIKEADETDHRLERVVRSEIVPETKLSALRDETNQLIAILTAISKNAKRPTTEPHFILMISTLNTQPYDTSRRQTNLSIGYRLSQALQRQGQRCIVAKT